MQVIGLFCDDVRREIGGTDTVVGILPDNINVPNKGGALPRLAVYIRVLFEPDEPIGKISAVLKTPTGETVNLGFVSEQLAQEAAAGARENDLPIAGIILRAVMTPFPIPEIGKFEAVVIHNDQNHTCAVLNIRLNDPNASGQPAAQSQPASPQT